MSEMIERVAAAMWRERAKAFPNMLTRETPDEIDKTTCAWRNMVAQARAGIEAMREPTDAMIQAALHDYYTEKETWKIMCDEALKDDPKNPTHPARAAVA